MEPKVVEIKRKDTPQGVALLLRFYVETAGSYFWHCPLCHWAKKYKAEQEITMEIISIEDQYTKDWVEHDCAKNRDDKSN